jgi:transcriptional regulator with XRE-family HTH domain
VTNLTHLRRSRGLSVRGLARLTGVSHPTLLRLERGESWGRPRTRDALSAFFGLPIHDILRPVDN